MSDDNKRKRQITFVVSSELGDRIDRHAEDQGLATASFVRHVVMNSLRKQPVPA